MSLVSHQGSLPSLSSGARLPTFPHLLVPAAGSQLVEDLSFLVQQALGPSPSAGYASSGQLQKCVGTGMVWGVCSVQAVRGSAHPGVSGGCPRTPAPVTRHLAPGRKPHPSKHPDVIFTDSQGHLSGCGAVSLAAKRGQQRQTAAACARG